MSNEKDYNKYKKVLQMIAPKLWPAPKQVDELVRAWHSPDQVSIIIVRHPLSRLASVYYNKFVSRKNAKMWKRVWCMIFVLISMPLTDLNQR